MSNEGDKKSRCLSEQFRQDLMGGDKKGNKEEGLLFPLTSLVKKDHSLSLEIRNNYINIYYRGGSLLKLSAVKNKKHTYKPFFEIKYGRNEVEVDTLIKKLPPQISSRGDLERWLDNFTRLKSVMDSWFIDNPKKEREFQQMVVWENNNSSIAGSTDYFIIDIEYDNRNGGRFDMVAIQWDSDTTARKLQSKDLPKLCFIEMKYGDAALGGKSTSNQNKSGIVQHAEQWEKYFLQDEKKKNIKKEMLKLFQQKWDLGLIPGLKSDPKRIKSFSNEIDCIFLIANHDPSSRKLKESILELEKIEIPGVIIKFCASNFMGYGLFKENVFKIDEFQKRYGKQIFNG